MRAGFVDRRALPRRSPICFVWWNANLADARVSALSSDRSFSTAYNAALMLATIVVRAKGYRATGAGHHWTTFQVLPEIMGKSEEARADYLDSCRRKRNMADYDAAGVISEGEVQEILDGTERFRKDVVNWLRTNHPDLCTGMMAGRVPVDPRFR